MSTVTIAGIRFSLAAAECIREAGISQHEIASDAVSIRDGRTRESLLEHCLDGAGDDRHEGWRDYVSAVVAAVEAPREYGAGRTAHLHLRVTPDEHAAYTAAAARWGLSVAKWARDVLTAQLAPGASSRSRVTRPSR
jgi:predicted HicB family RNase H-like nuclease